MSGQQPVRRTGPTPKTLWVALDGMAAAFLLAVSVVGAAARPANFGVPVWFPVIAAVLAAGPVAVRRRWPFGVLVVVLAANSVVVVLGVSGNAGFLVALALYTVAVSQPRWSVPMLAVALVLSTGAGTAGILASPDSHGWQVWFDVVAATIAVISAAWALGATARMQRLFAARAAQQAARRAVADERLRIARELHDVITHSMSLITVKASVANYLIDSRPEEVRDALTVIETTGRSALTEMRRMLGVLRADSDVAPLAPVPAGDERAPAPGLDDLAVLAEHAAEAGVHVDLDVPGECDLPAGVALTAYRIVQEALTNVVKHAAPTNCHVRVDLTGRDVLIHVTDAGHGRPAQLAATGGHGIIGMRERAALFGGEVEAGPRPHGGFRVAARLPLAAVGPGALTDGQPPG